MTAKEFKTSAHNLGIFFDDATEDGNGDFILGYTQYSYTTVKASDVCNLIEQNFDNKIISVTKVQDYPYRLRYEFKISKK